MKIKILKTVNLDLGDGLKKYEPSLSILEIDEKLVEKENLKERYSKFPSHIEIIEKVVEETNEEIIEEVIEEETKERKGVENGREKKGSKKQKNK